MKEIPTPQNGAVDPASAGGDERGTPLAGERSSWHLLHDGTFPQVDAEAFGQPVAFSLVKEHPDALPEPQAGVFVYLEDAKIKEILPIALERDWDLAILPHPNNGLSQRRFLLDKDLESARRHAMETQPVPMKLLTCNGIPVLSSVVAGKWLPSEIFDAQLSRWGILDALLRKIRDLRPFQIAINTAKGQNLTTAGVGFLVVTGPHHSYLGADLAQWNVFDDSRSTLIVLAPRSSLEILGLLLKMAFLHAVRLDDFPTSLGLIRSQKTCIQVDRGIDFVVDGFLLSSKTLDLECSEKSLRIRPGRRFPVPGGFVPPTKDAIRTKGLPSGGSIPMLSGHPLPFFNHATEDEFRDLFKSLKDAAVLSRNFLVLMVMSSVLALLGLYADSTPVIIGAMILAPLMGPIISLSMGLARGQLVLIRESMKTLTIGIGLALLCGITLSSWLPLRQLTAEMTARLTPNLLDLGVAIVSGMAGAYANAREEVAKSLAGVAIAVALVPPLCVVGIGLGWMDKEVIWGATLLFITNLVGISVAASLTFLWLGFAPFRLARTGLMASLLLLAIVSIPLYFAFEKLIEKNRIMSQLFRPEVIHYLDDATITPVSIHLGEETLIRIQITSRNPVTGQNLEKIRQQFMDRLGRPVTVEASIMLRR